MMINFRKEYKQKVVTTNSTSNHARGGNLMIKNLQQNQDQGRNRTKLNREPQLPVKKQINNFMNDIPERGGKNFKSIIK